MKYVTRTATGAWDLRDYERYLESEKRRLAQRVGGDDLLDISRFSGGEFRGSLHDSRFRGLGIDVEPDQDLAVVELRLEGPVFDRDFLLRYEGARTTQLDMPRKDDDLLMHELRLTDGGVAHELLFDGDHVVLVVSERMTFRERLR